MLLSHVHTRLLLPCLAQLTDPTPAPINLRTAADNSRALDQLTDKPDRRLSPKLDSLLHLLASAR